MASPLNKPVPDIPDSTPTPPSLSREPSTKRGRGLSSSSAATHSRGIRAPSPWHTDEPSLGHRTPETHLFRRPSATQNHSRQPSYATEANFVRQIPTSSIPTATNGTYSNIKQPTPGLQVTGGVNGPAIENHTPNGHTSNTTMEFGLPIHAQPAEKPPVLPRNGSSTQLDGPRGYSTVRRMRSTTQRKEQQPHPQPRAQARPEELGSVQDQVLRALHQSFVSQASQKLYPRPGTSSMHADLRLDPCSPGADPKLDRTLAALGYVGRTNPQPLVEGLLQWRLSLDHHASQHVEHQKKPNGHSIAVSPSAPAPNGLNTTPRLSDHFVTDYPAEWRSSVATYLICRVLLELLSQTSVKLLSLEKARQLEDIIYSNQVARLLVSPPDQSLFKKAKWDISTQVLGILGDLDFEGVAARFLKDISSTQRNLSIKGHNNKSSENDLAYLRQSMKYLRLATDPEASWSHSCEFMLSLVEQFSGVHGPVAKEEFCRIIGNLLLPLPEKKGANYELPLWRKFVQTLNDRLSQLISKAKYWHIAFPVQATLACVSPYDLFVYRWQQTIASLSNLLRERQKRAVVLRATCRLVWSYLQRTTDPSETIVKNIEEIAKTVFFSGKKYSLLSEVGIAEPLVQLVRIIGYRSLDVCFKKIIFPSLHSDILLSIRDLKEIRPDQLDADKLIIGIRAAMSIFNDIDRREHPAFPTRFQDEGPNLRPYQPTSPITAVRSKNQVKQSLPGSESATQASLIANLPESAKSFYFTFCEFLGKVTLLCNSILNGFASTSDKIWSPGPKTPIMESWNFSRREDSQNVSEDSRPYFELLHACIQALPLCFTSQVSTTSLLQVLCGATVHSDRDIASSSARSLQSLAEQDHVFQVVERYSAFVQQFDAKVCAGTDGASGEVDDTVAVLNHYVGFLTTWVDSMQEKLKGLPSLGADAQLDTPKTWTQVDRAETLGLFFLCSPSYRVRKLAVKLLNITRKLDSTLGKDNVRLSPIIDQSPGTLIDIADESLSIKERSLLERSAQSSGSHQTVAELCCSSNEHDSALWLKLFPHLIRKSSETCPVAVTQTREDICARLSQIQPMVETVDERSRQQQSNSFDSASNRTLNRQLELIAEPDIQRWKLYLIFACVTLTRAGVTQPYVSKDSRHVRDNSRSSQTSSDSFSTASDLFAKVVPLLYATKLDIRDAAATGLGSINSTLFKPLLETLDAVERQRRDDSKTSYASHQRAASSPRRNAADSHFSSHVVRVYKLTSHILLDVNCHDDWVLGHLSSYTKELSMYLRRSENEWIQHELRAEFCGLIEGFYKGINKKTEPHRWMNFQTRRAAFMMMEEWCGYSAIQEQPRHKVSGYENNRFAHYQTGNAATSNTAIEAKKLKQAALSAMATLCAGPISIRIGSASEHFDVNRILAWIDKLFNTDVDLTLFTGRRALKNVIVHNSALTFLLEKPIDRLYRTHTSKGLESYLEVIGEVIKEDVVPSLPFWKILSALLFTLGNDESSIRMKSSRLLRTLDERMRKVSKIQDFDVSVSDETTAVNKKAQFEISRRLAFHYPEHAFYVFSELSKHFIDLHVDQQRNIVPALLPWIKTIELQVETDGRPTAASYMVLVNLLKITINCKRTLSYEIQALWQALATGPHGGNVKLTLDFLISLSLERKDHQIIDVGRQIFVFLSDTEAGQRVIDFLLLHIGPKEMNPKERLHEKLKLASQSQELENFPYVALLSTGQNDHNIHRGLSIGQLCLILLVDLVVAEKNLAVEKVPSLLQTVFVLWDDRETLVREHAREMLVHLIHELVISKIDESALATATLPVIEDFEELIRRHDPKVVWSYHDNDGPNAEYELSDAMQFVVSESLKVFSLAYPGIGTIMARNAIDWALHCPVIHLACRSLQTFRCMQAPVDQKTVSSLLSRLHATASDEEVDIRAYPTETIRTCRSIIENADSSDTRWLQPFFWTICACLESTNEAEFKEALGMLGAFLNKYSLQEPAVQDALQQSIALLEQVKGSKWEQPRDGLLTVILRGCKSSSCSKRSLDLVQRLVQKPSNKFTGGDDCLPYAVIANIPQLSHSLSDHTKGSDEINTATILAEVAGSQGYSNIKSVLQDFAKALTKDRNTFLDQMVEAIRSNLFPRLELHIICFIIGLLSNRTAWVRTELLQMLLLFLPTLDVRKFEIQYRGTDFLAPVLRLTQSEHSLQALSVLDHFSSMTGALLDSHHLLMIAAGPQSDAETRRKFESTKSLYGVPEPSGWSVPTPSLRRDVVRNSLNVVHAAFFGDAAIVPSTGLPTPDEFYKDEHESYPNGYFTLERSATMTSEDTTLADTTNINDLVSKLDTLDDFFDTVGASVNSSSFAYSPETGSFVSEHNGQYEVYSDNSRYGPVTRNSSISSFVELKPIHSRERDVMSPSAFTPTSQAPTRPGLGARSVTSPAVNQRTHPDKGIMAPPQDELEPFSDDDVGRTSIDNTAFAPESLSRSNTLSRSRPSLRSGMRSSLKRLTGTDRARNAGKLHSPDVPPVPEVYLQNPKSSDL